MTFKIEGVRYNRFVICFRLADGRRRRWIRYAPAPHFMREAFERELDARGIKPTDLQPKSCTITETFS